MDILFENGTIRTLERNSPDAQALLVRNGRIAAVGGRTAVEDQTGIDVRRVDLAGRTLLPAFLDAHSHFTAVANQFLQVSLEGCTSWADMQDRDPGLHPAGAHPAGQWVTAQGYDHNLLSERRHPDRLCLDAAAPDNPVVICHQSGHMGVFNTAALERLGVTAQTPAPAGGVIGRENGTLTGYMEENAFLEFQKRVPMRPLESFLAAYRKAQDLYASYGITTVQEGLLRPGAGTPVSGPAGGRVPEAGCGCLRRSGGSGGGPAGISRECPAISPALQAGRVQDAFWTDLPGTYRLARRPYQGEAGIPGLRHPDGRRGAGHGPPSRDRWNAAAGPLQRGCRLRPVSGGAGCGGAGRRGSGRHCGR